MYHFEFVNFTLLFFLTSEIKKERYNLLDEGVNEMPLC